MAFSDIDEAYSKGLGKPQQVKPFLSASYWMEQEIKFVKNKATGKTLGDTKKQRNVTVESLGFQARRYL